MVSRRRMHPVNNAAKQREQANRAGRGGRRSSWLSKETWEVGEDEAQCCVGFGPGLHSAIVGEKATFTIQTNDEEDKPLQYGGLEFTAFLEVSACVSRPPSPSQSASPHCARRRRSPMSSSTN